MPFNAQCPSCRARFQVPWKKRDEMMACAKCTRPFVLIPDDEPPDRSRMMGRSFESDVMDAAAVAVAPPPRRIIEQDESEEKPVKHFDAPLAVALVSISIIGVAILVGQIPYGRFASVVLAPIGALAGGICLFELDRKRWLGWTGLIANAIVFVLMMFLPAWLGVTSWTPPADPNENINTVMSIPKDGTRPVSTEWVDASIAAWQQNDVRMELDSARIVYLNPNGKTADERKVRGIKISLKLSNVGVARAIECNTTTEPPSEMRMTNSAGQSINLKKTESVIKPITLFPGKVAEFVVVFDLPPELMADLKLEIPAKWFGNQDPIRFRIPMAMIAKR